MLILPTYCPGSKCDPCKTGNIEIVGNGNFPGGTPGTCYVVAYSTITHFPEFPVTVKVTITLQGIYRPFVGTILGGGGSTSTGGTSSSLGVICPLPSSSFQAPAGWKPGSSDQLLFNVKGQSSTTVGAVLDITTVNVLYHGAVPPVRWTGDVG